MIVQFYIPQTNSIECLVFLIRIIDKSYYETVFTKVSMKNMFRAGYALSGYM